MACSRSMFVRRHGYRIAHFCLLPTPAQSRYDSVSISDCYRSAVPPGQLPFISRCLFDRSWVFGLLLCAADFLFPRKRSVRDRRHPCLFGNLRRDYPLRVPSTQGNEGSPLPDRGPKKGRGIALGRVRLTSLTLNISPTPGAGHINTQTSANIGPRRCSAYSASVPQKDTHQATSFSH